MTAAARRRRTLIATALGSSIAFLDSMVVVVALPRMADDLGFGLAGQQWVLLSYSLALAALYLVAGAAGDRRGHKRLFVVGAVGFAAASALAGAAPSEEVLIAARTLQGVAGAFLTTNSLALLRAAYGPDSGRAIGLWTAITSVATLIGPPLGGAITQWASWRWIFFLNLPLAAAVVVLARSGHTESVEGRGRRVQGRSALAVAATFGLLTYGVVEGADRGFGAVAWAFAGAAGAAAALVWLERRASDPLLPRGILRGRDFAVVNATTFLAYAALSGVFVYLTLYLQFLGFSPFEVGVAELPVDLGLILLGARFGAIADRRGPRGLLASAGVLLAASALLFLVMDERSDFWHAGIVGMLVLAVALAVLVAPITSAAMAAAPPEAAGVASGVNATVSRLGGLLAVAVLGLTVSLVYRQGASHGVPLNPGQVDPVLRRASVDAFRVAMLVTAGLALCGALVALRLARRRSS